jgi:hypothetical protein
MKKFRLPQRSAPVEVTTLLFTAWVQSLAEQRLALRQHGRGSTAQGEETYNFGDPTASNFVLERSLNGRWKLQSSQGLAENDIQAVVSDALEKVASGDFGDDVVYQTTMQAKSFAINAVSMSQFARLLGDQKYIDGSRRLGDRVLLEFNPKAPDDPAASQLFAPETDITVTIFTPGPTAGDLSQKIAMGITETVGAICAFALGRVVEVPLMIFPLSGEAAAVAHSRRRDRPILGLAREHVSLDIFGEFAALGDMDGLLRVRGALLSYHAALQQSSPDVALMLLVSSLEALIVPRPEWRKEKATKRFIDALSDLCPEVIDSLVNHPNVERAFGYKKRGGPRAQRRQLLDQIYALRSNPTHSGLGLSGAGMLSMFADSGSMRTALLSDLACGALLQFLQAPRSSLIGHPMFDQGT